MAEEQAKPEELEPEEGLEEETEEAEPVSYTHLTLPTIYSV